jgi:hypothetical protein
MLEKLFRVRVDRGQLVFTVAGHVEEMCGEKEGGGSESR